jgi:hypothetical protein
MRPTGFEPVTFGFVGRAGNSAGLRGGGFQEIPADRTRLRSAGTRVAPCPISCPSGHHGTRPRTKRKRCRSPKTNVRHSSRYASGMSEDHLNSSPSTDGGKPGFKVAVEAKGAEVRVDGGTVGELAEQLTNRAARTRDLVGRSAAVVSFVVTGAGNGNGIAIAAALFATTLSFLLSAGLARLADLRGAVARRQAPPLADGLDYLQQRLSGVRKPLIDRSTVVMPRENP